MKAGNITNSSTTTIIPGRELQSLGAHVDQPLAASTLCFSKTIQKLIRQ